MTTTGTLPAPGTTEGRAALEQEARGHGFADARAYTEAYADGRVDTRGVGDRPGDPRTGFGQIQAYAKAAAIWGILLVEYATTLSPAEPTTTGAATPVAPPPLDDPEDPESDDRPEPPTRPRDTDVPDHTPEPVAPRADTTFQSVAATVAVVDMADGEAFDGIHSLDLVTPPDPTGHAGPEGETHTGSDAEADEAPADQPAPDGPEFGAGFPLVAGELGDPGEPGTPVELPVEAADPVDAADPVEAFGTGTGDSLSPAEALPDVGDEVDDADSGPDPDPADATGEDDPDDYADLGDHVPAPDHHAADPDLAQDSPAAHGGGESFT